MSGGGAGVSGAGCSYQKFVHFALEQTRLRTTLVPHPSQEKFKFIRANEENTVFNALSFSAPKIRLLRSLAIEQKNSVQVLDFAAFSEPEYDLPIFCANAFTSPARSIVVLDLNPLYDTTTNKDYREKYYKNLMPLAHKYSKLLPWGGKITTLTDYYKAWLEVMDEAAQEISKETIERNTEAQHRYLTWRAEKDPGYPLLKKLIGESLAKDLVTEFLFEGVNSLGTKSFLDYFPEYAQADGTVNKKRSMMGKSFETRPWDAHGEFIGYADEG
ncbi:hypothetical protein QOZ80_1BG0096410 [Eleusine coracana subsp. coracana]|nr:hypothetical protein QOZ80_1BG0096410 [Eleusine coracana subsp. coracana]